MWKFVFFFFLFFLDLRMPFCGEHYDYPFSVRRYSIKEMKIPNRERIYINDFAGVVPVKDVKFIFDRCERIYKESRVRIVIVTINDFQDELPEIYVKELYYKWGLDKEDTFLILFSINEEGGVFFYEEGFESGYDVNEFKVIYKDILFSTSLINSQRYDFFRLIIEKIPFYRNNNFIFDGLKIRIYFFLITFFICGLALFIYKFNWLDFIVRKVLRIFPA